MRPAETFVEQPIRSLQTMLRTISEDNRKLPTVTPDGIYGPTTMHAVTAFQRQNGLPVTGVTDQITWERVVEVYELAIIQRGKAEPIEITLDPGQIFQQGDSSPYIYLLQSMLTQLSNDHPSISQPEHSGVMDERTINSLRDFQRISGLPINGVFDRLVWKHLVRQFTLNAHHNAAMQKAKEK